MVANNKVVQGCQMVRSVTLQERAGGDRAAVRLIGKDFDLDLKQISSSELAEVATSIAITLAQFSARYTPTVLVIDRMAASLDSDNLLSFVERLSAPDIIFQTLIIVPTRRPMDCRSLTSRGGSLVWLEGKKPNVTISRSAPKVLV